MKKRILANGIVPKYIIIKVDNEYKVVKNNNKK